MHNIQQKNQLVLVPPSNNLALSTSSLGERITKLALQHLNALEKKMTNSLARSEPALKSLEKYRRQAEILSIKPTELLTNGVYLQSYGTTLLDPNFLEKIGKQLEEQKSLKESVLHVFRSQIDNINKDFPQELSSYVDRVIQELEETLELKQKAFQEQGNEYLSKVKTLEQLLKEASNTVPLYSVYGKAVSEVTEKRRELKRAQESIFGQINAICGKGSIRQELEKKIQNTVDNIETNKNSALSLLEKHCQQSSMERTSEKTEALQTAGQIYLEDMNNYLVIVSKSVNQLLTQVERKLAILIETQDEELDQILKKSDLVIETLNQEVEKIVKTAQTTQKPIVCEEYGIKSGLEFDDSRAIAHGRIQKVELRSGFCLDGIQLVYEDEEGKTHDPFYHGGKLGSKSEFSLSPEERITKVALGKGAFTCFSNYGIEEISFTIRNSETGKERKTKTYGRGGNKDAIDFLKKRYGEGYVTNPDHMQKKEFFFGNDYYLGAIIGREAEYISSLALVFFRDFSPILRADLEKKVSQAIEIIGKKPQGISSGEQKNKIEEVVPQTQYVDLTDECPHRILGVSRNADLLTAKRAYNRLCLKYHPDKIPHEERYKTFLYNERFQKIQSAYRQIEETLSQTLPSRPPADLPLEAPSSPNSFKDNSNEKTVDLIHQVDELAKGSASQIEESIKNFSHLSEELCSSLEKLCDHIRQEREGGPELNLNTLLEIIRKRGQSQTESGLQGLDLQEKGDKICSEATRNGLALALNARRSEIEIMRDTLSTLASQKEHQFSIDSRLYTQQLKKEAQEYEQWFELNKLVVDTEKQAARRKEELEAQMSKEKDDLAFLEKEEKKIVHQQQKKVEDLKAEAASIEAAMRSEFERSRHNRTG